jgi:Dyp-type peroxidase family
MMGWLALRRSEDDDIPHDAEPNAGALSEVMKHESRDGIVQNHMAAVSTIKYGWFRDIAIRGALWLIEASAAKRSRPGYIDKIGTIHFARWFQLPGTNQLVFLSNYDGSWQSYLEDFIARLREGLSSIWSNTIDFPRTVRLIAPGAGDGARFKRWARRQQVPSRVWYTAYPKLTTDRIRANAMIRHGFASASTEVDAASWLSLFGFVSTESLETVQIPALVFGGMRTVPHAHCLMLQFGDARRAAEWLHLISPDITYGENAPTGSALVAGFTARALRVLGLDDPAMATFPMAFQQGMSEPNRARSLGDTPADWNWGQSWALTGPPVQAALPIDVVLIVYEQSGPALERNVQWRINELRSYGLSVLWQVPMRQLPPGDDPAIEAFGFRDGISQPVMAGTLRASREGDPANVVNPGELLLGYRDNLNIIAPTPQALGQDIGRNGSFLVIRQLEQDAVAFNNYLTATATHLINTKDARSPTRPRHDLQEWLAAKLVGRWRDGSSLVRNPNEPATRRNPGSEPDNRFMFGTEDPDGMRCPLGAHIRRANPRDSFEPGSNMQVEISNRHRILRVGRSYAPPQPQPGSADTGLLFMCVNADIERQFEFLQQTWILGPNFHDLPNEVDPLIACGAHRGMTVPTPNGPLELKSLSDFVRVVGGAYFFMPSRSTVDFLTRNVNVPPDPRHWALASLYP